MYATSLGSPGRIIDPLPFRADRNAGDHRNFIAAATDMTMNGSLPDRSPGLDRIGNEEESRLIAKNYVGAQASGFFLARPRDSWVILGLSAEVD
jgi:hypothetical protein